MFEFLSAVRESEVRRDAMVLILDLNPGVSAVRLHRSTKAAAVALGADRYAVMPTFDAQVLVALIQKLHRFTLMLQQSGSAHEKKRAD
jgi:hypothetical protein